MVGTKNIQIVSRKIYVSIIEHAQLVKILLAKIKIFAKEINFNKSQVNYGARRLAINWVESNLLERSSYHAAKQGRALRWCIENFMGKRQ